MKTFIIIFMIVILFTAVSVWNYRRYMPKPIPLGSKKYKVVTRQITIPVNGKNIYGELLLPEGISGKLPTVICSHGYGSSYKLCKLTIGKGLAMSGYAAYCFDFYGGSKKSKSGGSMLEMSIMTEKEELLAVIDYIKKLDVVDAENLYLFGESQGGMVSGITAVDRAADVYKNAEYMELPGEIHGFMGKGKKEAAKLTYQFLERVRG